MVFETPADLAHAFEVGDATEERWKKTLARVRSRNDLGPLFAALTSPDHLTIAGSIASVVTCPVCDGAKQTMQPLPAELKAKLQAHGMGDLALQNCRTCRGSGLVGA